MEHIERLTLEEEDEELEVEIGDNSEGNKEINLAWCFAGRFLTNRPIRVDMMKIAMAGVWCPVRGVTIKDIGAGVFVFQFHHHLDVQKVLKGGPWFFNKHMLILGSMAQMTQPEQVPLYSVPFWVQVHNLPAGAMSEKNGRQIAESMGEFLEYDAKNNSNFWRKFMRIRVMLDVRRPLKRTKRLKKPGGGVQEVQFNYERLGMFCYYCGLLGHTDESCDLLFSAEFDDGVRKWGPEVRVEFRKPRDGGGGRWLREEGQNWKTPNQEEREESSVINASSNVSLNAEGREKEPTKNLLAELMRNPSNLIPKHNRKNINAQIMRGAAESREMNEERNKEVEGYDSDIIIEEKKRKINNTHLSHHVSTCGGGEEMMEDENDDVEAKKDGLCYVAQAASMSQMKNFLSAGPGKQACREK
jgi:hypothetical protein